MDIEILLNEKKKNVFWLKYNIHLKKEVNINVYIIEITLRMNF